jgi:NHL repeat/WD40-like Beta Propeller Repeat
MPGWKTPLSWRARLLALLLGSIAAYAAPAVTPAFGARGHVFERTIGSKGKGNGQLEGPAGLAVSEANGDLYVVDRENNRVQYFNAKGEYQGQFSGPSATGTGTLTKGSVLVEGLATETGAFTPGEEIEASGLPPATTILAVKEGGVLELSQAATTTEPAALTAHQQFVFSQRNAIAVDNSCTVRKLTEPACKTDDPSNNDIYVTSGENSQMVVDKFTAAGGYLGQISQTTEASFFELVDGVAVDPQGKLSITETHEPGKLLGIDSFTNAEPNVFNPPSVLVTLRLIGGLAVDAEGNLYIDIVTAGGSPVVKLSPTGQVLDLELDPESSVPNNGVATEVPSSDVYVDNVSSVKRFAADGSLVEAFGESQLAGGSCPGGECTDGLTVNSSTGRVYVSEAVSGVVLAFELQPPGPPVVVSESVLEITSESATLAAEPNPQSVFGEPGTSYRFQYGPCTPSDACSTSAYGASTPLASLAASFEVDAVSAHVQGLSAGTVYHYRVVAENSISKGEGEPVVGVEGIFTTRGTGEFVLPDGREWEMVSPPLKSGALIDALGLSGAIQAAAGGGAFSFVTNTPSEPGSQGYTLSSQVLSTRDGGGWSSLDVALPHAEATGLSVGRGQEVRFFSEDLSAAVVQPFGPFDPAVSGEASEQTPFLHSDYVSGASGEPCSSSCFRPLVSAVNATSGVPFGEEGQCGTNTKKIICGPEFLGATADLRHVVVKSATALTAGGGAGLYEWSAGKPPGEQLQPVGGGSTHLGLETAIGSGGDAGRNAISSDGSRVFSSAGGHLSMTDLVTHRVLQVDAPEAGCLACGEGAVNAEFQGASSDGSRVFFADTQKLNPEGGVYPIPRNNSSAPADLYECEIVEVAGAFKCNLADLSPGGAQLGTVVGVSGDGSWVYFVANGVLASGAVSGGCPEQPPVKGFERGVCNLYVRHGGVTRLVAVLSTDDIPDWSVELAGLTARVSPDGVWLAFMSRRSLTGYDNRDAVSGKPDEEVFVYNGENRRLVCASCDSSGARPHGVEYGNGGENLSLAGGNGTIWDPSAWIAANIPAWTPYTQSGAIYQSRYLSDSGRMFFDAGDGLVSKDVNGTEDVYQYEPAGVPAGGHACGSGSGSGSEVFAGESKETVEGRPVVGGAGCVALVSSGSAASESAFLDASVSGGDVFFMTTAKLSKQDFDGALDVYDAHECTGVSPCLPVVAAVTPACGTEASCDPAPSPQPEIFGPPASATFAGPENVPPLPVVKRLTAAQVRARKLAKALKVCRKDRSRRRRVACERVARKRYGVVRAGRASHGRGSRR